MADSGEYSNAGRLSQKVLQLAAGEAHTLALTGDGKVFSWGRGTFGRLGTGKEEDEVLPVRVEFDCSRKHGAFAENSERGRSVKPKFVQVAAGAYHSLALEDDGSVWCWGYNIYGQLGLNLENSSVPRLLDQFLVLGPPDSLRDERNAGAQTPLKVCTVKAGGMMSLAIDSLGSLWIWGNCPSQGSGGDADFSLVSISTPVPVWDFHGHTVVKVACGNEHVVALVSAGETFTGGDLTCYSWGGNNHGQLGLGDRQSRVRPEIIETFNQECPWQAYEVACGAFHTAVLTHKKDSSIVNTSPIGRVGLEEKETICWTFGMGDNGQLGHGNTDTALSPKAVEELPSDVLLISVDCGFFHTCVVSSAGEVWSWGMEKGLGLCPDASFTGTDPGDALSPLRILSHEPYTPKFLDPVQVVCGAAHTILLAHGGYKLWAWGRGRSGVLGRGNTIDSFAPCLVMWPPLHEDFNVGTKTKRGKAKVDEKKPRELVDMEESLSLALEQVQLLQSRLTVMERYASILHGSIFGKPFEEKDLPHSLQHSSTFDIAKEWENVLEAADNETLARMEMFFRNILMGVKNKRLKRRIQEMIKECLQPPSK